ncbi:MAG: TlpA disulfide reductase family protein, partial [Candidatus Binatia bacterium]
MNQKTILLLILGALAIWGMIYLFHRPPGGGPQLGSIAPDFTLEDRQKNPVSLSSLRGKAVLLNFWASWCGPCLQEMPSIEALYRRYKDKGFVVLGVSLDEEGWKAVGEFLKQVSVSFPI